MRASSPVRSDYNFHEAIPNAGEKSSGSSDVYTCPFPPLPSRENDIYDGRPVPRCPQEVEPRRGNLLPSTEVSRSIPADADVP